MFIPLILTLHSIPTLLSLTLQYHLTFSPAAVFLPSSLIHFFYFFYPNLSHDSLLKLFTLSQLFSFSLPYHPLFPLFPFSLLLINFFCFLTLTYLFLPFPLSHLLSLTFLYSRRRPSPRRRNSARRQTAAA